MRVGDLRHRVTIQAKSRVPDGMGGGAVTWVDIATVYAAIWPIRGLEGVVDAQQLEGKVTHQIRMWYRDDLTVANRLKLGNRYFNLRSVKNAYERNINLEIMAEEEISAVKPIDWSSQWSLADNLVVHIPLEEDIIPIVGADIVGFGSHVRGSSSLYTFQPSGLITTVTDNVPCFETVGGLAALRDEPLGMNLIHFSHELGDVASAGWWVDGGLTSVSANGMLAPDGNTVADGLVGTAVDATHQIRSSLIAGVAQNDKVALTIFGKVCDKDWVFLVVEFYDVGDVFLGDEGGYYFNISTGVVGSKTEAGNATVAGYIIEPADEGFYRIGIIISNSDAVTSKVIVRLYSAHADNDNTFAGDAATVNTWLWGVDCKKQAFFDSYVPTSGATATRATESGYPLWTLPAGLFDSQGTAIVWVRWGYPYSVQGVNNYGIVSTRDSEVSLLMHDGAGAGRIRSSDATNLPQVSFNFVADTWYKLAVKWSSATSKMRVGYDSGSGISWGTETSFDGSYTLGTDLRLAFELYGPMWMRDLRLYNKVLTDLEVDSSGSP